ncbi:MAG: amidohydrolase [Fuerstiella sp.]|nr:amidohydrolase [Fuerstiella sp.]MCP4859505.1 amidohydrolase [Fuerstiella sp.]
MIKSTEYLAVLTVAAIVCTQTTLVAQVEQSADTVLVSGRILTMDADDRIKTAIAIRGGRILAVGSDDEIRQFAGANTEVVELGGRMVIPGIIAAHCHAVGVAKNVLQQPHVELLSISAVQDWIRERAKSVPAGTWIRVPRADITRLKERRHPTPAELDAACTTHPVIFTAARKSAINSMGLETIGVKRKKASVPGGEVIFDSEGRVRLIAGANAHLKSFMPQVSHTPEQIRAALQNVHRHYNSVGITSIFERAGSIADFLLYRELHSAGNLTVRMTQTFRSGFRTARDVTSYTEKLGMRTGDGDDWVCVGPLKITVDGGIHWGNTYLRESYGEKRIRFYVHRDPDYRGDLNYSVRQMTEVFREGHRLGWQWCCHVTGDAGVDAVLDSLSAVHRDEPDIVARRFSLTHAYFPALDSIARAKKLGVCVDTQPSLYFKDSAAIAEVYGADWAARFIGLGDWVRGGVPTAIAGDHMMGLDPDHAMNAYNPFLMLQVAVTRRNREGRVYGQQQRISRLAALRCLTASPAYLSFTEDTKGTLEKGKLADLAILDLDFLNCPEDEIGGIKVLRCMVDGRFVFDRE